MPVIVLDTHIWVWWVNDAPQLNDQQRCLITDAKEEGLVVSVISCWEVAKLYQLGRLKVDEDVGDWLDQATNYPGIEVQAITVPIIVDATTLPGNFHRDPADELIVATARVLDAPLLTVDERIRQYAHVKLADAPRE